MKGQNSPSVRASLLAAKWAQKIGLPTGNSWEPAIARTLLREWTRLGSDELAWAAVEGIYTHRLGLSSE